MIYSLLCIFSLAATIKKMFKNFKCIRGELALTEHQTSTKPVLLLPSSAGQGRNIITKNLWAKVKTWKDHSSVTITDKTDSGQGNYFIKNQISRVMRKRINNNTPCPFLPPGHNSTKYLSTFFLCAAGKRGVGLTVHHTWSLLLHPPQGEHYSHLFLALMWGLSPRR